MHSGLVHVQAHTRCQGSVPVTAYTRSYPTFEAGSHFQPVNVFALEIGASLSDRLVSLLQPAPWYADPNVRAYLCGRLLGWW